MKIKTSELTGPALDWAVAKCEDYPVRIEGGIVRPGLSHYMPEEDWYKPSEDWSQGGPIIEREGICLKSEARDHTLWQAQFSYTREVLFRNPIRLAWTYCTQRCPTPLIAAMRCYVASKLGDEVDVPEDLVG